VSVEALDLELRERNALHDREPGNRLSVRVLHLPRGSVKLDQCHDWVDGCLGMLILDGRMIVELHEGRGRIGWVVGEDDVVRPWELQEIALARTAAWRALKPTRIALLDNQFALRARHIPQVVCGLLSRSARTTQWLLAKSLIASSPRLEDRLMLMFALLGERWGRVAADGILLDLPLTHDLLATLCGARRPAITQALGAALRKEGTVTRLADGRWLLRRLGSAPGDAQHWSWQAYAEALGFAA
jgi:CRP/FNR family cyclic AMP-dependent transcriptional regulator